MVMSLWERFKLYNIMFFVCLYDLLVIVGG